MTFIHFNAYATPIQIKRYSVKDLEVQEQLLTDDFDTTSEPDMIVKPQDSISQQGSGKIESDHKQSNEQAIKPPATQSNSFVTQSCSLRDSKIPPVTIQPIQTSVSKVSVQPNVLIEKPQPQVTTTTTTTKTIFTTTSQSESKPMPLLNLLAKAKIPLERTESEESGTSSNSSMSKPDVESNTDKSNTDKRNTLFPNPIQPSSIIPQQQPPTISKDIQLPQPTCQTLPTFSTQQTVPTLPLPDRLVSTACSDVSVVSQKQPIFAIDQQHWNDLVNRLHNQECEQEKLKGQVKRLMLMWQTTQQSAKRDAADLRTELHTEMEDGAKKVKNEIVEYTQIREFECKHYTDKRLKDEMNDVKFQIDTLSQQLGSLHNMTATICSTKPKPKQEKSSLITGIIVGLFILYNLAQWMSYLLKNPALQYYSTNNLKPFYPS